ncbi:CgeB family protein [Aneurinibacillus terranovensis]|uniref:CgeB family protein n=1 Tax=Aneurinibacillus terranovensis TaxID=278991 RepID=UPI00040CD168|nr:glycosyltransferase [Aneurinibacillus terranovensis]
MRTYKIFFLDHRSIYLNSIGDAFCQYGNQLFYQSSWNLEEIEAGIAYCKPDLLFTVGCDLPLFNPALDYLPELCRKYRLFHVYWATEDAIHHQNWSIPFVQKIMPDMVWTIHPDCVAAYEALGIPACYFDFAFNPRIFPAKETANEVYDVSFIGHPHLDSPTFRYESFRQLLVPLIEAKKQVHIWGGGWGENTLQEIFGCTIPSSQLHGFVPYKQTSRIYHQSKVVLGVQNGMDQVSQRTFEIMGSGAFMIGSRTDALTRLFTEGVELILCDHPEQATELFDYYINRPLERRKIGLRARKAILKDHTFFHRFAKVWPALERNTEKKGRG